MMSTAAPTFCKNPKNADDDDDGRPDILKNFQNADDDNDGRPRDFDHPRADRHFRRTVRTIRDVYNKPTC